MSQEDDVKNYIQSIVPSSNTPLSDSRLNALKKTSPLPLTTESLNLLGAGKPYPGTPGTDI